jgi:hypothetical protein
MSKTKTKLVIILFFVIVIVLVVFKLFSAVQQEKSCNGVAKFANPFFDVKTAMIEIKNKEFSSFGKKEGGIYRINLDGWDRDVCRKIEHADVQSFEVLNRYYAKDKNSAYVIWEPYNSNLGYTLSGIDSESFDVLSGGDAFSKDKNHAYYHLDIVEGVDAGSFELLENSYARDSKLVYHVAELSHNKSGDNSPFTQTADVGTFQVLSKTYAKDKNNVYLDRTGKNTPDFEFGVVIQGADPATFRVVERKRCLASNGTTSVCGQGFDAEDKNTKYKEGKAVGDEVALGNYRDHEFVPLKKIDFNETQPFIVDENSSGRALWNQGEGVVELYTQPEETGEKKPVGIFMHVDVPDGTEAMRFRMKFPADKNFCESSLHLYLGSNTEVVYYKESVGAIPGGEWTESLWINEIKEFAGKKTRIYFRFKNYNRSCNNGEAVYLDNLEFGKVKTVESAGH